MTAYSSNGRAVTVARFVDACITISVLILCSTRLYQFGRDVVERHDVHGGVQCSSGFGHAVHCTTGLVLSDGIMAFVAERFQAHRTVSPHPGQQHPEHVAWP